MCLSYVKLQQGNATAISYTWGEFNRQPRQIGHFSDGRPALLKLGEEWNTADLISVFDDLCKRLKDGSSPGYCWLDQFCISQESDSKIRDELARIPDIYRYFNVTILIPGSRCQCLDLRTDWTTRYPQAASETERETLFRENVTLCLNDVAISTYVGRLWPRQEMLYARCLRLIWIEPRKSQCRNVNKQSASYSNCSALTIEEIQTLSPVARLWLQKCRKELEAQQVTPEDFEHQAYHALYDKADRALEDFLKTIYIWKSLHIQYTLDAQLARPSRSGDLFDMLQLLTGAELETTELIDPSDTQKNLYRFTAMLVDLYGSSRSATRLRDYVIAVWVDCPGYKIPENFQTWSLGELLEDALKQFENNLRLSPGVYAASGVFDVDTSSSRFWRPRRYLDSSSINTANDVYGTLIPWTPPMEATTGHFTPRSYPPLSLINAGLLTKPRDYVDVFSVAAAAEALQFLCTASLAWTASAFRQISASFHGKARNIYGSNNSEILFKSLWNTLGTFEGEAPLPETTPDTANNKTSWDVACKRYVDQIDFSIREFQQKGVYVNHYDIMFHIACRVLGINVVGAKKAGLRLMVRGASEHAPPLLGLSHVHFRDDSNLVSCPLQISQGRCLVHSSAKECRVCPSVATAIFETALPDINNPSAGWRVVGVWIPARGMPLMTGEPSSNRGDL